MLTNHTTPTDGYARPSRTKGELYKRLQELDVAVPRLTAKLAAEQARLVRLNERLAANRLASKASKFDKEDIANQEKEIARAELKIQTLSAEIENSKYYSYEINQIREKLIRDEVPLGIHEIESACGPDFVELSAAKPYYVTDAEIDQAICCFETAKTKKRFSEESKKVFNDGIIAMNDLRKYRTFKHYDQYLTGVFILVMMQEDHKHGPHHKLGEGKFFYPVPLHKYKDSNLVEIGRDALHNKTLPFNGTINTELFSFMRHIFPNYLVDFYQLDTTSPKLDTSKRTKRYLKKQDEKKLLRHFKDAYRKDYQYSFFKNPFSTMKTKLDDNTLTMKDVRDYVKAHPKSRSARVYSLTLERGTQRLRIKVFTDKYLDLYSKKTFHNPFSFMRRKITTITSTEEIYAYAEQHPRSRSAAVVDDLVRTLDDRTNFLKR